jgi:DNA-binding NarL/FixJ family response regulator
MAGLAIVRRSVQETGSRIRVLVVEDHPIFRNALAQVMSLDKDIEVAGLCSAPEEALAMIEQAPVDVIITDLAWRGDPLGGIKLVHRVRASAPETRVIVCSAYDDEDRVRQAIQAGVDGYLLKDEIDTADVARAVKAVRCNKPVYSDAIVKIMARLLRESPEGATAVHPLDRLTAREREIVPLLMDGLNNAEIAQRLTVAKKTVKTHVSHILQKLSLSSRYQVAGYMRQHGRRRPRPDRRTPRT